MKYIYIKEVLIEEDISEQAPFVSVSNNSISQYIKSESEEMERANHGYFI